MQILYKVLSTYPQSMAVSLVR